jgi:hypothetical protein
LPKRFWRWNLKVPLRTCSAPCMHIPSLSEALHEAALAADRRAIHAINR